MLRISVFQFKGEPPVSPLSCEFDERGGTIGRESSNALALPDPERHMSRVQAEVQCVDGGYVLVDHGGNPTTVNGMPVGKGNSTPLRDGDEIGIAFYAIRVEIPRAAPVFAASTATAGPKAAPTVAPMAAPIAASNGEGDPLGLFAPSAPSPASASASAPVAASSSGGLFDAAPLSASASTSDPFASLLSSPPPSPPAASLAASDDPFAVFAAPSANVPKTPEPARSAASTDDPFAAFGARPKPAAPASALGMDLPSDALGMGLGHQASEPSALDSLFNLDSASRSQDPFAGSALADPLFGGPSLSTGSDDPLALLSGGSASSVPTERNDAPMMREAFVPPKVERAVQDKAPDPVVKAPVASGDMTSAGKLKGGVVSWEAEAPALPSSNIVSSPSAAIPMPAAPSPVNESIFEPAAPSLPKPKVSVEGLNKPVPAASPAAPIAASSDGADANSAELLNALAKGLGITGLKPVGGMTPEFMEHVGKMLREAAHGTIELLLARAVTKREVRAEMTMIVSKNNNPLKFSPDVSFALMQLIAPQGPGFMSPVAAMRDAYDDLRAHQIGTMAGMRGALSGVLARFKPEDLEARLSDKSFLDSVLPGGRKAKLWDLYEKRFAEISSEAEDNFHTFFGREFLKAYEEQLDRLHDDRA